MQHYPATIQTFSFQQITVQLWVPDTEEVRRLYQEQTSISPYWAKLWPSAIALCRFIVAHPGLIHKKHVLELAAGLGLPGIVAAQLAQQVIISDYVVDAVAAISASVALNEGVNVSVRQLDWHALPPDLPADVLLLSDINYDPADFEVLYQVLTGFMNKGTMIILATPQRLMAKSFIERLLPFCVQQEELSVSLDHEQAFISILVLKS